MAYFGLLDIIVVVVLLLASLAIGFYFGWTDRNKENKEFLIGGKKMGTIPVALSIIVSYMCSQTLVGWPVEIYTRGTQIAVSLLTGFVAMYVAAEIFIPVFYKLDIISVNSVSINMLPKSASSTVHNILYFCPHLQYLDKRFQSKTLTIITSVVTTFCWVSHSR